MLRPEYVSINQTVFFIEPWSNAITRATVTDVHADFVKVTCHCVVDHQDQEICKTYGSCSQSYENLCASAFDANRAKWETLNHQIEAYCKEITSLQALLLFATTHNINEDCCNVAAKEAFKRRSKDLYKQITGTDLSFPD